MAVLNSLLDNYEIILFDMDGVITSEQNYWNCAALTVFEVLTSKQYLGSEDFDAACAAEHCAQIREQVFFGDKTIAVLKDKGLNSNWDLGYVVILAALLLGGGADFEAVYRYVCTLGDNILPEYDRLAALTAKATGRPTDWCRRLGTLWQTQQQLFQDWYLGTDKKPGLIRSEQPLIALPRLQHILSSLHAAGKRLGYGTGRQSFEVETPLKNWDVLGCFEPQRRISYDAVTDAEAKLAHKGIEARLTKPHPYMFWQGLYGLDTPAEKLLSGEYDRAQIQKLLVVGDAGADILAAQALGADFCAVLTGVTGKAARPYFEEMGATYILDSIEDFVTD